MVVLLSTFKAPNAQTKNKHVDHCNFQTVSMQKFHLFPYNEFYF